MSERATLTVPEAAKLLGVSRSTAYEAARVGDLPVIKLGRRLLVPRARLDALLKDENPERFPTPGSLDDHGDRTAEDVHRAD